VQRGKLLILGLCLLTAGPGARADSVPMPDYIRLSIGMTEAEVLYRIGPYDHETVAYDHYHFILYKTWYYIPAPGEARNNEWITEVRFDGRGLVTALDRYKPR
jgi:hypothetical protein